MIFLTTMGLSNPAPLQRQFKTRWIINDG